MIMSCPHCGANLDGGGIWDAIFSQLGDEQRADEYATTRYGATRTEGRFSRAIAETGRHGLPTRYFCPECYEDIHLSIPRADFRNESHGRTRIAPSRSDIALIERAFPPGNSVPAFDVPRFWSNPKLDDPDTIIALVLEKPTTKDLARTVVSYGPLRVLDVLDRLDRTGELSIMRVERAQDWLGPIIRGIAEAARDLLGSGSPTSE